MRKSILLLTILLATNFLNAQIIEWQQNYGGEGDDKLSSMIKTSDGGFLLGGESGLSSGLVSGNNGSRDYWIVKINEAGEVLWEQNYGGSREDVLNDLIETSDGGFLLGGYSASNDGDVGGNYGWTEVLPKRDYWVVKIDALGNMEWEQNYGGTEQDVLEAVLQTSDGGYLLGGKSESIDENVGGNYGDDDYWVVKIDESGNIEWEQNYGGTVQDWLHSLHETSDGDFILGGQSVSGNGNIQGPFYGSWDYWIVKINASGNIQWEEKYGGSAVDNFSSMVATSDGGYLLGGRSKSNSDLVGGNNGEYDFWVVKINGSGNVEWEQNYGGTEDDYLNTLIETQSGGFLLGGYNDASINGDDDCYLIKIDALGNVEWEETYGGSEDEEVVSLIEMNNSNFFVGSASESTDGDVQNSYGNWDYWLLRVRSINQRIRAKPFFDENENGSLDEGEQPMFNFPFTIDPTAVAIKYYTEGTTTFLVDPDTYTVAYDNESNGLWQVENAPESYTIDINEPIDTTFCFPMRPVTDFYIQWVDLSSSITRCFGNTNVWLTYTNNSSEPTSGYVHLVSDDYVDFISASPPVDSIAGDTLYWFYENLYPTHSEQIKIVYDMPGIYFIGANISFDAQIETWEGYGNDKDLINSELVCAYDPNDKQSTPTGYGMQNYTLFEDTLDYTIRFQNTGTDTAFNIIIRDTISDNLDLSSFRFIASSHDANIEINPNTRIIEFQFDNIYLPDSNVNEIESHGFLKFEIEANEGLAQNTVIENTAGIYFDFNPPIVTNTTHNTMVDPLPLLESAVALKVYLEGAFNPATGEVKTDLQNLSLLPTNQPFNVAPYNYNGTEAISIPMNFPENTVDWVLVEARTGTPNLSTAQTTLIESAAGFLIADGMVVGVDGEPLIFRELEFNEGYHFVIRHRNHLDIISRIDVRADAQMSIDFTASKEQAFGTNQQKTLPNGQPAMYVGDYNQDGIIQTTDYDIWKANPAQNSVYGAADGTLDGIIQTTDFDAWRPNKAKLGNVEIQF